MAKLRHIAITVPDPSCTRATARSIWRCCTIRTAARKAIEAAAGTHWMGEAKKDGGFYEVKFHDPDGIAFDITANGWLGGEVLKKVDLG